jgi:hypothetical protein
MIDKRSPQSHALLFETLEDQLEIERELVVAAGLQDVFDGHLGQVQVQGRKRTPP